ncbi:hypothetical protein OEA41_001287 [Lepraria neglecta]|uniref:Uncharacterized protein n=1 Tax=Lepraria neglecta TaxID=209136 RepID=A0AAD9ZD07_9LECA|nr:hypothetical protein OEA41_001287 [Lepraria neglecta]
MGRKKLSTEEVAKKAKANGYSYGACHEEDSKEASPTYEPKSLRDQSYVLERYEMWVASVKKEKHDEGVPFLDDVVDAPYTTGAHSLRAGLPPLDRATTKDFFRFYALTSDGKLAPRVTADSLNSQVERFFAAFTRLTGSIVTKQDRKQIYAVSALWPQW